jgi:hypothetical protein
MYSVSPIPKPINPLATITTTASIGKAATAPALPNANRTITRTAALLAQRTMLAEIGFILNKARLYRIGATAQLTAAPNAANSPSITALIVKPLEKLQPTSNINIQKETATSEDATAKVIR